MLLSLLIHVFAGKNRLKAVDYNQFRQAINDVPHPRIRSIGKQTILYDKHHRVLAVLKSASINALGRPQPTQYFISQYA